MSTFNRSYLDAIGLPVWVSRQAAVVNTDSGQRALEKEPQLEKSLSLGFISMAGNPDAAAYILISAEQDLQQAKSNFQLLSQAWKQWQDSELPLALVQLVEQDASSSVAKPIDNLKDKQLLHSANQGINLPGFVIEQSPSLNWQSASDKKAWWQLLQNLA